MFVAYSHLPFQSIELPCAASSWLDDKSTSAALSLLALLINKVQENS